MIPFVLHSHNLKHLSGSSSLFLNQDAVASTGYPAIIHDPGGSQLATFPPTSTDWIPTSQSNATLYGPFFHKHIALRAVVGTTCCLSMLGALLIILSYICVKETRTKARKILVHLSFADFGVACTNFVGVTVYFDQYIRTCPYDFEQMKTDRENETVLQYGNLMSCPVLHSLCKTQAFFAAFSTLASVMWTLSLAVYIYCLVVHNGKNIHMKVVYLSYFLCWGMPLFITVWLVAADYLGYSPQGGSGWCSLKIVDPVTRRRNIFVAIFGNDFWVYLTFVMVTILYLATHCHIKFKMREVNPALLQGTNKATVSAADTKFLLIPFSFLLLRIWTTILVFLLVYLQVYPPKTISYFLLYAAGIGDSGQGFVNAFLFCVFTPKVRKKLLLCIFTSKYSLVAKLHKGSRNQSLSNLLHSLSTKQGTVSPSSVSQSVINDECSSKLTSLKDKYRQ